MSLVPKELVQVVVLGVNTPRSGEDSLKLNELMELCTKLQQRVLDLETTKTTQALEIDNLKRRVKKLKRRKRSRTYGIKRQYKVGLLARLESFKNKGLGEEDASKHRKIIDIDANEDIYFVNVHNEEDMFDADQDLGGEEVKKKDQIQLDEEVALKLQAELQAEFKKEQRFAGERAQQEEEGNIALIKSWDDVQAKIDADYELALRLQVEEQKELTDVENEKLFMQFLEKRRKTKLVLDSSKKAEAEVIEGSSKRAEEELEQENDKN
nr:hypothetical protein [Tanacetum cinerariifolium]